MTRKRPTSPRKSNSPNTPRKSNSPINPRKSHSPTSSEIRRLVQAAKNAPRRPVIVSKHFNIYNTQRLPNRAQQLQIAYNRTKKRLKRTSKDRKKIAAMQRKLMADLEIENGPNGPIVSRNNSPRRQSNSSSDQSYHTAYGSPQSNSSSLYYSAHSSLDDSIQDPRSDPDYYVPTLWSRRTRRAPQYGPNVFIPSRNNSPRRQSNSSSDQSYHTAYGSPQRNSSNDQSYYSAYTNLCDLNLDDSNKVPRNITIPDYHFQPLDLECAPLDPVYYPQLWTTKLRGVTPREVSPISTEYDVPELYGPRTSTPIKKQGDWSVFRNVNPTQGSSMSPGNESGSSEQAMDTPSTNIWSERMCHVL